MANPELRPQAPLDLQGALRACTEAVGAGGVGADAALRREYAQDLIEWEAAQLPICVVRATSTEQVVSIMKVAARYQLAVAPRGGGLSYTKGYVPGSERVIALDLSGLDGIEEINERDLFLTAGAGATWQRLQDALRPRGLRTAAPGPISGVHSTVGGAASQNVLGSMDGYTGLEIVLASGEIIRTGSAANRRHGSPYYRNYGPDLTGLFLGDTGAFGIKTKVSLRLEPIPEGVAFASFAFPALPAMVEAMTAVASRRLAPRSLGLDEPKNRSAADTSAGEAAKVLRAVMTTRSSLGRAVADAFLLARGGRSALREAKWSLHYVTEGIDQACAERSMAPVRAICKTNGQEIAASVPMALHARPYSIRGILGPEGERWISVSGVFPLSRARQVAQDLQAFFDEHRDALARSYIAWSVLTATEGPTFLIEPMFYWSDALGPLHRRYLGRTHLERFGHVAANPDARAVVLATRAALRDKFLEWGAVHAQIGKYYDFRSAVAPEYYDTLSGIKRLLDPDCRLNPGNFGWQYAQPAEQR